MNEPSVCRVCGASQKRIIVKEGCPGGGGFSPIAAQYDWDHQVPNDCLKTINSKLDQLLGCPNKGQEG